MYPILYLPNEKNFTTQGLGVLSDAISAVVEEQRNGSYELMIKYPFDGIHFAEIQHSCILKVKPYDNAGLQLFRIYKITSPMNKICTIYAEHVSYQLNFVPLMPFAAYSAHLAFQGISSHMAESNPFTFWTDIDCAATYTQEEPEMVRARLGGQEGSILDVYGGEYEWDNFVVKLHQQRGIDRDVTLQYGKNITDISQEESIANTYTGVTPFWRGQVVDENAKAALEQEIADLTAAITVLTSEISTQNTKTNNAKTAWTNAKNRYGANSAQAKKKKKAYQNQKAILDNLKKSKADSETSKQNKEEQLQTVEGTLIDKVVTLTPTPTIYAEDADAFPFQRIRTLDLSDKFEEEPTQTELRDYATTWMAANTVGEPSISIKVSFVALWDTEEYKDIAPLERVQLCDTVMVEFQRLGIKVAAKVTAYKYDVIMERYESIQLGDPKSNFTQTVSNQNAMVVEALKQVPTRSAMQDAIDIGTSIINGGYGGYLRYNTDADGQPTEMLIMDAPELADAHQVIRMNKNGIGYSTDGGLTYSSAWVFLGDGTQRQPYRQMFYADLIRAGVLGDQAGKNYWNMESGEFKLTASATSVGNQTLDAYTNSEIDSRVGGYQGITLTDGKLYIVAENINGTKLSGVTVESITTDRGNKVLIENGLIDFYLRSMMPWEYVHIGYFEGGAVDNTHGKITINTSELYLGDDVYIGSNGTKVFSSAILNTSITGGQRKVLNIGTNGKIGYDGGSSRRYKHDIKPLENPELDPHRLYDLVVKQFKYNDDIDNDPDDQLYHKDIPGFIAEEVEEIYPIATLYTGELVHNWDERKLLPPMLSLIQEQHAEIEALKARVEALEKERT